MLRQYALGRGALRPEVLVGPAIGEDASVVDLGGGALVLSSDPITGAAANAGWLAVHVGCNDIGAMGVNPLGVLVTLLLPGRDAVGHLERVMADVHRACLDLEIAVLGGHSEVTAGLVAPILCLTAIGRAEAGRYVTSAGAHPGNEVVLTGAAAIEGSAILASDFADELMPMIGEAAVAEARRYWSEISIVRAGIAAAAAGATAMHDVTEGGVFGALHELAEASGVGIVVDVARVPVRAPTAAICNQLGVDPLALVSSGALLIAAPPAARLADRLIAQGIAATPIGQVVPPGAGNLAPAPARDELWRLLEQRATGRHPAATE